MAFKSYKTRYDTLDRFVKKQLSETKAGAGETSRARTKKMIGLGQSAAAQTEAGMESSAQGVRKIFNQVDIGDSREETNPDLEIASWMQSIEETVQKPDQDSSRGFEDLTLTEELFGKKGVQEGKVAAQSYFNEPIITGDLRGNSRKAGDVTPAVQQEIVNKIVEYGSRLDMSDYQIAYALATARYESGFNPDAAAKSSSARGLGQFINSTGENYGITSANQWDVDTQIQALLEHTVDNFTMAEKKGYGNEYVYALHHDGPALDRGGLALAREHIMPFVPRYQKLIDKYRGN